MSEYSQPDFYRFSEDSLRLVDFVVKLSLEPFKKIADFGAGCGVIGIELARRLNPQSVCFLEAQTEFQPHLKKNIDLFLSGQIETEILLGTFSECPWEERGFDLILCNPPFYLPGHGEVGKDPRRHICRSFHLDSWDILFGLISKNLAPQGLACFVLPNEEKLLRYITKIASSRFVVTQSTERNLCFLSVRLNEN